MSEENKIVEENSTWYKWENFESEYLEFIRDNNKEIYAVSIKESESALIVLTNSDFITLSRYYSIENGEMVIDENIHTFDSIVDCLKYLRSIQQDHAVDYDYKKLVKKLISQLYLNDLIKPEDIIS